MGKNEQQFLQQSHDETQNRGSSGFLCQGCSMFLRRIANECSFKCLFVLILSLSVVLSGIFWILPRYTIKAGFDAKEAVKLSATVQAYFRLEKPVSQLIPYIEKLEYDLYSEIGVPNTKVAVLSMHQSGASNRTDAVFGVLSDQMNDPINPNVYVQITNVNGSTVAAPVIVQASVMSNFGGLLPPRLKQLAQTIAGSRAKNLGLDNSVFGKVNEIILSSYLKGTVDATPPSPSPAPSPKLTDYDEPPISPYHPPSYSPTPPPTAKEPPCFDCELSSPAPSIVTEHPPDPCPYGGFTYPRSSSPKSYSNPTFPPDHSPSAAAPTSHFVSPSTEVSPDLSPKAEASHGFNPSQGKRAERLVSRSFAPFPL